MKLTLMQSYENYTVLSSSSRHELAIDWLINIGCYWFPTFATSIGHCVAAHGGGSSIECWRLSKSYAHIPSTVLK